MGMSAVLEFRVADTVHTQVVSVLQGEGRHLADVMRKALEKVVSEKSANFVFTRGAKVTMVYAKSVPLTLVKVMLTPELKSEVKKILLSEGRELAVVLRTVCSIIEQENSSGFLWK